MKNLKIGDNVIILESKFRFIYKIIEFSKENENLVKLNKEGGENTWYSFFDIELSNEKNSKFLKRNYSLIYYT